MKVIGYILDSKYNLVGLHIKGKSSEFGIMGGGNLIEQYVSIQKLIQDRFKNSEVDCSGGKITEIEPFKLVNTNCYMLGGNNQIVKFDNTLEVMTEIREGDNIAGYTVLLNGSQKNLTLNDIDRLSKVIKIKGYSVVHKDGKVFLRGLAVNSVDNLNSLDIGVKSGAFNVKYSLLDYGWW